jgi:hypothetical protein
MIAPVSCSWHAAKVVFLRDCSDGASWHSPRVAGTVMRRAPSLFGRGRGHRAISW